MNHSDNKVSDQYQFSILNNSVLCEVDSAEEKEGAWLVSFVDILCLLVTLFVLLLSFNRVTQDKDVNQIASGKAYPTQTADLDITSKPFAEAPRQLSVIAMPELSIPQNVKDMVDVIATSTKVNLVIKNDVLFAEASTELTPLGRSVLDGIAQTLMKNDFLISVEGHTDNIPIHTNQFPSNWELSSFRATNVARYFIQCGISRKRLSATGYADTRPVADNDSEAGRARNRRVSLVIQTNESSTNPGTSFSPVLAVQR